LVYFTILKERKKRNKMSGVGGLLTNVVHKSKNDMALPMSNNAVIRTDKLGDQGGQATSEYLLYKSNSDAKQINGAHLDLDIQALPVLVSGTLQYVPTGYLFAIIILVERKERAGKLNATTKDERVNSKYEDAQIYDGDGVILWSRHGSVDGGMPRENINLMIKNTDWVVPIKQESKIVLVASIYTDFARPQDSQRGRSAIMIGKLEFNVTGRTDEVTLL